MITEKQIKNLKKGDPIVIHTTFDHVDSEGDVRFLTPNSCGDDNHAYIKLKYISLPGELAEQPKPKYDPCRPFKKGDIVRYVERDGRSYVDVPPVGETCRVCGCEDIIGMVSVEFKFSENEEPAVHEVPFYHLELITPVEEMAPYHILHNITNGYVIYKDNPETGNIVVIFSKCHPDAKTASEAECARLNEAWIKQQEVATHISNQMTNK